MSENKLGDTVFCVRVEHKELWETCRECCGSGVITVIMGDESRHQIECEGCKRGYERSTGLTRYYEYVPSVRVGKITGVKQEMREGVSKIDYEILDIYTYCYHEDEVFTTEEAAQAKSAELAEKKRLEDIEKLNSKIKPHRSWSWHAHYHRRGIREAERNLKHHTDSLNIAKLKTKEDKIEAKAESKQTN